MSAPDTAASPPLPLRHCYWVVPGLLLAGEHPDGTSREKTKDRLKKLLAAGIECFVDLTKPTELQRYDTHLPFYVEYTRKAIKDHGLPASREQMVEILEHVSNAMRAGRPVYVHCRAGIGRTGTVIGCLLVERGLAGDAALTELNRLWQQSRRSKSWAYIPETDAQANYVREWTPGLAGVGFELNSLASAVAGVGPMKTDASMGSGGSVGTGVPFGAGGPPLTQGPLPTHGPLAVRAAFADVQARAAVQSTGAGQARAAVNNLASRKGRKGSKRSSSPYAAGAGLTATASKARAAAARREHSAAESDADADGAASLHGEVIHAEPPHHGAMRGETTRAEPGHPGAMGAEPTRAERSGAARMPAESISAERSAAAPMPAESISAEPIGPEPIGAERGPGGPLRVESLRAQAPLGEPIGSEAVRMEVPPMAPSQVESLLIEPMSARSLPRESVVAEPGSMGSGAVASAAHVELGAASGPAAAGPAAVAAGALAAANPASLLDDAASLAEEVDPLLDPATMEMARQLRERFVGALFGLAVGDAVAAATQFRRPGSFTPVGDMIGGGPFDLPRGAWSDDTAMALCLADSLLECDGFDPRDQMQRYALWQQEGYLTSTGQCVGITASTARALAISKWRRMVFPGSHDPEQLDPEPLSRVVSVALFYFASLETTLQQAADSSRTTCQAPAVVDACRRLGRAMNAALSGQPKERILAEAPATTATSAQSNGTAASALAAAFWAFSTTDNFRDAVLRAANVGGNSDVVAAVCGQLAGAHYGMSAIPPAWRNGLMEKELIEAFADRMLAHGLISLSA